MREKASVQPARSGPGTLGISSTIRAFLSLCAAFPLRNLGLTAPVTHQDRERKSSKPCRDSNSGLPNALILLYSQLNQWILRQRRNHKFGKEQQDFLLLPASRLTDISARTNGGISARTTLSTHAPGVSSRPLPWPATTMLIP